MSFIFDKLKFLEKELNRNPLLAQRVLNARLDGLSIKYFSSSSEYSALSPKDNDTLYLVQVDASTINLYKGSTRIPLGDKINATFNHAIVINNH